MNKFFGLFCFMILGLLIIGCSDDTTMTGTNPDSTDPDNNPGTDPFENAVIWTGTAITFTKANDSDHREEANQDRLTDNVIITRSTAGGQIFNIAAEGSANKNASPVGTEWAIGRTSDLSGLTFAPFRAAVGEPQDVVGKDLVLHLIDDDIYLNVNFSFWAAGKSGGFEYSRATP